jgi:hypothetical protein
MRTSRLRRRPLDVLGMLSLLGLVTALSSGCLPWPDIFQDDGTTSCLYGGQSHPVGEGFPSTDGCNTCSCEKNGAVACTLKACAPATGVCRRTGCSGELCSDQNVASDCVYRPEFACYKDATCERRSDGACGFAPTASLAACLASAGANDGGCGAACDFAENYEYGYIGGNVLSVERSFLTPGNGYRRVRTPTRGTGAMLSCSVVLPPCGSPNVITAQDIEAHDLVQTEVRAALAETPPPLFGSDPRPVDGSVFEFKAASGGSFLVGGDCQGAIGCRAIPVAIAQLHDHLVLLDAQELATPACQSAGFVQ